MNQMTQQPAFGELQRFAWGKTAPSLGGLQQARKSVLEQLNEVRGELLKYEQQELTLKRNSVIITDNLNASFQRLMERADALFGEQPEDVGIAERAARQGVTMDVPRMPPHDISVPEFVPQ